MWPVIWLPTIVSRENNPIDPAVVTVGSIHGGTKHNIIGDTARLQLSVRSFSGKVRQQLLAAIERKARAVASGAGAPERTPSLLSPLFYPDAEATLFTGVSTMAATVLELLQPE